jgi:hypothetical protein
MQILRALRTTLLALVLGISFSIVYNVAAFALLDMLRQNDESLLTRALLAPGLLLAGHGFEAQAAVLPANLVAFAILFSGIGWILLRRRSMKKNQ